MSIIHDKFVYIHIEKTAGTSLEVMFSKSNIENLLFTSPKHLTITQVPYQIIRDTFNFTIARNPFARQYSFYQNHKRDSTKRKNIIFEEYFCSRMRDKRFYQQYYLEDTDYIHKVYQTEKFDEMLQDLSDRFGVNWNETVYEGREHVFNRDYRPYYSQNMIKILTENEPILMELFGYSF